MADKEIVMSYLSGPMCQLFAKEGTKQIVDLNLAGIEEIVHAYGSGAVAVRALQGFKQAGKIFPSFQALLTAVRTDSQLIASTRKTEVQINADKAKVVQYLTSPQCKIFSSKLSVTDQQLRSLVIVGSVEKTINIIGRLQGLGRSFTSFDSLKDAVKDLHTPKDTNRLERDKKALLAFLSREEFALLPSAAHFSQEGLTKLAGLGPVEDVMQLIDRLERHGVVFEKFADLVNELESGGHDVIQKQIGRNKKILIDHLARPECELFTTALAVTDSALSHLVSLGSLPNILAVVSQLETNNKTYNTFEQFMWAVQAHMGKKSDSQIETEKHRVIAELTRPESTLFTTALSVNNSTLVALVNLAPVEDLLRIIGELEQESMEFSKFKDFCRAVKKRVQPDEFEHEFE